MPQKKVVSIQSLGCHGKCSLTEAMPILSAAGFSVSVLPTTLLSTHTGGFGKPAAAELSDFLKDTLIHWQNNGIGFDCVYCGYFANKEQLKLIKENLNKLCCEKGKIIVDPVMGDNGRFFSGITKDFTEDMLNLCKSADIILPNITEACFLSDTKYTGENIDKKRAELILRRLFEKTQTKIVLTGIDFGNQVANAVFDGENIEFIESEKIPVKYHGTGDIFASVLTAAILHNFSLCDSVKIAGDFVSEALRITQLSEEAERNGVEFESAIPYLLKLLNVS